MDELFDMIDGMLKASKKQKVSRDPNEFQKWKQCVALHKLGWKAFNCIKKENSDSMIVTWRKDGQQDIQIELTFIEQCIWFEYLSKGQKDGK